MRTKPNLGLAAAFSVFFSVVLAGQTVDTPPTSVFDFLTPVEGTTLLLELNMDSLLDNRKNAEYIQAQITTDSGKTLDLEVRTRGKYRRKRCEIPPIKIKFSKSMLRAENLDTLNEIKLVLPCADRPANEQLIIREYVVYRMFETLSPERCTRARLIRLHLKDHNKKRPKKMMAMLVEHEEQVSARLGGTIKEVWGVRPDEMDADHAALMTLFQYMIGNTDWETISCRNIMLVQPSDTAAKILPIPYDFDFSGLVAAPYAVPNSECGIRHVQDRYLMYRENGVEPEALEKARNTILTHKDELYRLFRDKNLSDESIEQITAFMDVCFEALESGAEIPLRLEYTPK